MTTTVNLSTVTESVTVNLSTTTQTVTLTVEQNNPGSVTSVNGQTSAVVLDADDIDDAATTNKFTTQVEKDKLAGIQSGAEANVNADWNASSGDAQILNKPTLGTAAALNVGTSASQVVQLDGSARLPAVDGSQLTNLPAGFADPMTTAGDIIIRNGSNTTTRLGIGSEGQVLKVSSGVPSWAAESGGGGGLSVVVHSSSTSTTLSPTVNTIYLLKTTSNAITVTLPDSPASGSRIRFCDADAKFATNNVTIDRSGTNTIADGSITQLVLNRDYSYVELTYDSGNWSITGGNDFVDFLNSSLTDEIQTVTYNDGGTSTLDNGGYNAFSLTANGTSTTIAHSNVPGTGEYTFRLHLTWSSGSITWPETNPGSGVTTWTKGMNAPTATGNYIIQGVTIDGGTSWTISVVYQ